MIEETAAKKACFEARQKLSELWTLWAEKYPDNINQTLCHLVITQIASLKTLVRLAAEVIE